MAPIFSWLPVYGDFVRSDWVYQCQSNLAGLRDYVLEKKKITKTTSTGTSPKIDHSSDSMPSSST